MTKIEIIELYLADLNNLVADSDAKRSRIIDLEDELIALKQGQSLPIHNISNCAFYVEVEGSGIIMVIAKDTEEVNTKMKKEGFTSPYIIKTSMPFIS